MKNRKLAVFFITLFYCIIMLMPVLLLMSSLPFFFKVVAFLLSLFIELLIILFLPKIQFEQRKLRFLYQGYISLRVFIATLVILLLISCLSLLFEINWSLYLGALIWIFLMEALLFWNGLLKVFLSSVQLGIKRRILIVATIWLPIINLFMLNRVIRIVEAELDIEYQKDLAYHPGNISQACATKYPLVFVHGVFFRDMKYLNYWGRIPCYLTQHGATIYYGEQESAHSVAFCAEQLSQKIQTIIQSTDCHKVNIIAHSKGGLDSRAAIANFGLENYVASLTTINTPHQGCLFAYYLLGKLPKKIITFVERRYNKLFKLVGDQQPNFLAAVTDLTNHACTSANHTRVDSPTIFYQSIISYGNSATAFKFPLNLVYPLVKHFDGKNDGLVSITSASYFPQTQVIKPTSRRGISHADIIDLYRENIPGFDVRDFYKNLVEDLRERGY